MIFALGFLVSGLLTLMFLPAFWRRALRLSTRRLEMQMPLSMTEIVAERDQLRAEFARDRRQIEQRSEILLAERAHDMGELGRRARLIAELDTELAENKRKVLGQTAALQVAERRAADAEGQFAAADKELFDLDGRLARVSGALADLDQAHKALTTLAEERRATVGTAEALASTLAIRVDDLQREREALTRALAAEEERRRRINEEFDFTTAAAASTAGKLQTANSAIGELSAQADKLRSELGDERRAKLNLETKAQIAARSLADAVERENALRANLESQAASLRSADQDHAAQISALRAEGSALEGALQAARKELNALRAELANARNAAAPLNGRADEDEDAMLRQTIQDVGAEVSRLIHTLEDRSRGDTTTPGLGELMRALQVRAGRTAPSN